MLKKLRISVLLFILANVALGAWLAKARSTDWDEPLVVVVYAINGDGSEVSQNYIDQLLLLDDEKLDRYFGDIETFFEREAARYGLDLDTPVEIEFAGQRRSLPPAPPSAGSTLAIIAWSLKLRFWAWRHDHYPYSQDVEIFVLYFDPAQSPSLAHSLGLQKGLIGVVNAFAAKSMRKANHVIVAHELLHTLGASDKYDPVTNFPLYPDGFADPHQDPLLPQTRAEIMAGRTPVSRGKVEQARRLKDTLVGAMTAQEINWQAVEP